MGSSPINATNLCRIVQNSTEQRESCIMNDADYVTNANRCTVIVSIFAVSIGIRYVVETQ